MTDHVLTLPRRLAIEMLSHAQRLEPGDALLGYLSGPGPEALRFHPGPPPPDVQPWAEVRPQGAPPRPGGAARLLTIGLDTKGVLQLRCWHTSPGAPVEQPLEIR